MIFFTHLIASSSLLEELLSLLSELLDLDLPFRNSFRDPVSVVLLTFSSTFLSFIFSFGSLDRSGDRFASLERSTEARWSFDLDLRSLDLDLRSLSLLSLSLERSRLLDLSREEDLSYLRDRSRPSGERRLLSRRSGDRRLSRRSDERRLRSRDLLLRLSPGLGDLRRYLAGLLRGGLLQ